MFTKNNYQKTKRTFNKRKKKGQGLKRASIVAVKVKHKGKS